VSGTIVKITLAAGLGLSSLTMDVARTSAIPIIDPGVATAAHETAAHTGRDYGASAPGLRSLSMLVAAAVLAPLLAPVLFPGTGSRRSRFVWHLRCRRRNKS
jgi:hypothetical protein